MATQSGITVAEPNAPFTVVGDIPRPTPGPGQALVKTLAVGINPM
jgi:NADPH:quinone reductase-like Zn-dependent oxidoreductase